MSTPVPRLLKPSGLCLLAALVCAGPSHAKDVYRSDFAAASQPADLKDWRLAAGQYQLREGWLLITSDKSNPQARLNATLDGDGTFRATVRNARNCHRTWIVAKGVYRLEINNQFVRLELHRQIAGGWKLVAEAPNYGRYSRDSHTLELRLAFAGRRVCAFIGDKKLIDFEDAEPAPHGGAFELGGGWGTDVAWRSVRISDQPDLSEWPHEPPARPAAADLVKVTWVRGLADDNIYFDGDKPGLRFKLATGRAAETKLHLVYRLVDVRQQTVAEKTEEIALKPGADAERSVEFAAPRRGCFKIALWAGADGADLGWVEDLGSFSVLPRAVGDRPRNPDSCFGGHMDGIHLEWHLRAGRKLGVQWARCHDMLQHTWWTRVQPDGPDQWKWYDPTQKTLDELGFSTLGEFLWTPRWASRAGPEHPNPQTMPPRNEADFARYVANTVGHYRNSIRHWEVWNEPHYAGFWAGTPEEYAGLLAVAYREAKKAAPDCFVLGGGGVYLGDRRWIARMIKALPDKCMDGFSIHYQEPETAAENVEWLRAALKGRGIDAPVWNTEAGVQTTSFLDQSRRNFEEPEAPYHFRNACFELVRMYMENIACGVRRVFYYDLADPWRFREFAKPRIPPANQALGTGMWDEGRMLKPIAAAHAAMALAVEGKSFRSRLAAGQLRVFIFEGKDGAAAVHFACFPKFSDKAALNLTVPPGLAPGDFTVIDFMGNESTPNVEAGRFTLPMSREPVYLLCRGARRGETLETMYAASLAPNAARPTDQR